MRIVLRVTSGVQVGHTFVYEGHDTFLAGRSRQAHFRLPQDDEFISRLHFLIELNPPHCRLVDLESTNHTFVNGHAVASVELHHGDEIRIGRTLLRLEVDGQPVAASVSPADRSLTVGRTGCTPRCVPEHQCAGCDSELDSLDERRVVLCPTCSRESASLDQCGADYLLIRKLGNGNLGTTYRAVRTRDRAALAVKVIRLEGAVSEGLLRNLSAEMHRLTQMEHFTLPVLREVVYSRDCLLVASDFVSGNSAQSMVDAEGPLTEDRAVELTCQVLEGLEYAHAEGIFHGNLKPSNVLIGKREQMEEVRLLNVGLLTAYQNSQVCGLTLIGRQSVSPFLAPERITRFSQQNPPSDQYSAACLLYFFLTGTPPYKNEYEPRALLSKILNEDPIPLRQRRPTVRPAVAAIVERGLQRSPEKRFPSVTAMLEQLARSMR